MGVLRGMELFFLRVRIPTSLARGRLQSAFPSARPSGIPIPQFGVKASGLYVAVEMQHLEVTAHLTIFPVSM